MKTKSIISFFILFFFLLYNSNLFANKCSHLELQMASFTDSDISELVRCHPKCTRSHKPAVKSISDPNKHKSTDALRRHNEEVVSLVKDYQLTKGQQRRLHDEITGKHLTRTEVEEIIKDLFNIK